MTRKSWLAAGAAVLCGATATGAVVIAGAEQATPVEESPASTAKVERGRLAATVSLDGTLTYRARADGSPYSVINQASGIYTELPDDGDKVDFGDVLYRVDDEPVLLLRGVVPAYRDLKMGDEGNDVRQLNRNLHELGYDADAGVEIDPDDEAFTWTTREALERLQDDKGFAVAGALGIDDAVFLPWRARISKAIGKLGGPAAPGRPVAEATSGTLEVQVDLGASQQGTLKKGDRAQITLPGNRSAKGRIDRLGRVARAVGGDDDVGDATIPAYVRLVEPKRANGLDSAPVRVDITTRGVRSALSVPVTALVGRSGGGFAVEVTRNGGRRELVAVELGLFDTTRGRVQVDGDLDEGDKVVVPSL